MVAGSNPARGAKHFQQLAGSLRRSLRDAALLSHGTAEQVYLLLRIALADQLTRPGELSPLILDDPTPHFDTERTLAVLDLLLQVSEERQVILFSQEPEILAWAERHLTGPDVEPGRHRLTVLRGPVASS